MVVMVVIDSTNITPSLSLSLSLSFDVVRCSLCRGKLRDLFPTNSFSGGVCLNDTGFDLLTKLLAMNPASRISASQALQHPWLTSEEPYPTPIELMPRFSKEGDQEQEDVAINGSDR